MGSADGFSQFLEPFPDPAWIHELESLRLIRVNRALASLTGYTQDQLLGMYLTDLIPPEEAEGLLHKTGESLRAPSKDSWRVRSRGGPYLELEGSSLTVSIQDQPCRLVIARLRSGDRKSTRTFKRPTPSDTLSAMPGKAEFLERLGKRIQSARESSEPGFAVFLVDLDRFKLSERSLGSEGAGQLLAEVARRLEALLHPDEMLARLEGDCFIVLLEDVSNVETALHLARELQEEIEALITVSGRELQLTAGVGVALGNKDAGPAEEFLKNAGLALKEAKAQGPAGLRVFALEMQARAAHELRMELDLRPGIEGGDLKVLYQPIINLRTGLVSGFEALSRWHHPELGLIMPGQFISLAERTGLIVELGKVVMREACRQVCEWQSRFRIDPPLYVTVNCSPAQFADPKLATLVKWALANSGLQPNSLKLELTESVVMEESQRTARALDRILELGVQMMIDDFGTGYSSLSRLHQLPIETLKIDRTFISGIVDRSDSQMLTRAIIQMARSFNMKVTAEGIENAEQLAALRRLDCDFGQGYFFSPAIAPDAVQQLLASGKKW